jgi:hypothetical protein
MSFPLFCRSPFMSVRNDLGGIDDTFAQRVCQARWPAVFFEQIIEGFVGEFLKRLHALGRKNLDFMPCLVVKLDALPDHSDQPSVPLILRRPKTTARHFGSSCCCSEAPVRAFLFGTQDARAPATMRIEIPIRIWTESERLIAAPYPELMSRAGSLCKIYNNAEDPPRGNEAVSDLPKWANGHPD